MSEPPASRTDCAAVPPDPPPPTAGATAGRLTRSQSDPTASCASAFTLSFPAPQAIVPPAVAHVDEVVAGTPSSASAPPAPVRWSAPAPPAIAFAVSDPESASSPAPPTTFDVGAHVVAFAGLAVACRVVERDRERLSAACVDGGVDPVSTA